MIKKISTNVNYNNMGVPNNSQNRVQNFMPRLDRYATKFYLPIGRLGVTNQENASNIKRKHAVNRQSSRNPYIKHTLRNTLDVKY